MNSEVLNKKFVRFDKTVYQQFFTFITFGIAQICFQYFLYYKNTVK